MSCGAGWVILSPRVKRAGRRGRTRGGQNRNGARAVFVIAGPTASGKSALALDRGRAFDGTVINADSMQVYRDLAVLTARPGPTPAPPRRTGSTACWAPRPARPARWRAMALDEIDEAHAAGRVPVVVGGTGLYLKALLQGSVADAGRVPDGGARGVRAVWRRWAAAALPRRRWRPRDPEAAARLEPSDSQR